GNGNSSFTSGCYLASFDWVSHLYWWVCCHRVVHGMELPRLLPGYTLPLPLIGPSNNILVVCCRESCPLKWNSSATSAAIA
ncbi:hypothetical protein AVEN_35630-1, partial [Araneus ventricosus]